jgi:hypothetical protein
MNMDMKGHILAALREEFDRWEELLMGLSAEQIAAPLLPSAWSIKDVIVHLWAWQQRTIVRMGAALDDREPEFPNWKSGVDPEANVATDETNAWIYEAYRERPWSEVYQNWREGFIRLLEAGERITERDLLDGEKYPWLEGYSLALVLLATYDHHQEHLEKILPGHSN